MVPSAVLRWGFPHPPPCCAPQVRRKNRLRKRPRPPRPPPGGRGPGHYEGVPPRGSRPPGGGGVRVAVERSGGVRAGNPGAEARRPRKDMITDVPKGPGMTTTATRYLHLVRHGEATPDESGLTGKRPPPGRPPRPAPPGRPVRGRPPRPAPPGGGDRAPDPRRTGRRDPSSPRGAGRGLRPPLPSQGRTPSGIRRLLPPLPRRDHPRGAGAGRRPGPPGAGPVHRPGRG